MEEYPRSRQRKLPSRFADTVLLDELDAEEAQVGRRASARFASSHTPHSGGAYGYGHQYTHRGTSSRPSHRSASEERHNYDSNAYTPYGRTTAQAAYAQQEDEGSHGRGYSGRRNAPHHQQSFTQSANPSPAMIAVPPQAPQQATPAAPLVPEINPAALDALVGGLSQFLPVAAAEPTPELLAALEAAEEIEFPPATQKVLGQILDALVKEENTEKIPVFARNKAKKLKSGAHTVVQPLCIGFEEARIRLQVGHFQSIQELYRELESHCYACWKSLEEANQDNPALDQYVRQYLIEMCHLYAQEVIGLLEEVAESRMGKGAKRIDLGNSDLRLIARKARTGPEELPPLPGAGLNLPPSVRSNTEPYFQGAWRREPFPPRPYMPITEFVLGGPTADEQAVLSVRLTTQRPDGASEHFRDENRTQLGDTLPIVEARLAEAVRVRDVLKQNEDVIEMDAWGIDMYTRRNVYDALIESGLFEHWVASALSPKPVTPAIEPAPTTAPTTTAPPPTTAPAIEPTTQPASTSVPATTTTATGSIGDLLASEQPQSQVAANAVTQPTGSVTPAAASTHAVAAAAGPAEGPATGQDTAAVPAPAEQPAATASEAAGVAAAAAAGGPGDGSAAGAAAAASPAAEPTATAAAVGSQIEQTAEQAQQPEQPVALAEQPAAGSMQSSPAAAAAPEPMQVDDPAAAAAAAAEPMAVDAAADADVAVMPSPAAGKVETAAEPMQVDTAAAAAATDAAAATATTATATDNKTSAAATTPTTSNTQPDAAAAQPGSTDPVPTTPAAAVEPTASHANGAAAPAFASPPAAATAAAAAAVASTPIASAAAAAAAAQASGRGTVTPGSGQQPAAAAAAAAAGTAAAPSSTLKVPPLTPSNKGLMSPSTTALSPQVRARMAALEWRGWGLSGPPIEVPTDSKEPLRPKTEPGAGDTALAAAGGTGPLDAAAANLPPPPTAAPEVVAAVQDWIDKKFLPALNHTGSQGYNMLAVCETVRRTAAAADDSLGAACADVIEARIRQCGWPYFRIHPKGRGIQCTRKGGIKAFTLVEEYLGEIHSPWRWWEMQDALRKVLGQEDLPDFYNITLERPRDDPQGYDVLYVEAAFKATFASRMSHSCTPNCQAVVVSAGGRLSIAMHALRDIEEGEELTFDYSSVTESEKEFRSAICMCGTQSCRGSYLHFLGAKAFGLVLDKHHTLLHRQTMILRACTEPLTDTDRERLREHGFGTMALEQPLADAPRCPSWLHKWAALALEYVELERRMLPGLMLGLPAPFDHYTEEYAQAQAQSVMSSRITSIITTLDKLKLFLRQPGQGQAAPLRLLSEPEVMAYLWSGDASLIKRAVTAATPFMLPAPILACLGGLCESDAICSTQDMFRVLTALHNTPGGSATTLAQLLTIATVEVRNMMDVRRLLLQAEAILRACEDGTGMHTAAADILHLSACTVVWFTAERNYKSFSTPPVVISEEMIKLHKPGGQVPATQADAAAPRRDSMFVYGDDDTDGEWTDEMPRHAAPARRRSELSRGDSSVASKRYGPWFMWGQLSAWHKHTVADPSASLSAERRGTLSIPDIECCYATRGNNRYTPKERMALLDHVERRPDMQWKASALWTFRNDYKTYGSPMMDSVFMPSVQGSPSNLSTIVGRLRSMPMNWGRASGGVGAEVYPGPGAPPAGRGGPLPRRDSRDGR